MAYAQQGTPEALLSVGCVSYDWGINDDPAVRAFAENDGTSSLLVHNTTHERAARIMATGLHIPALRGHVDLPSTAHLLQGPADPDQVTNNLRVLNSTYSKGGECNVVVELPVSRNELGECFSYNAFRDELHPLRYKSYTSPDGKMFGVPTTYRTDPKAVRGFIDLRGRRFVENISLPPANSTNNAGRVALEAIYDPANRRDVEQAYRGALPARKHTRIYRSTN